MTYPLHSRDAALAALGFVRYDDGTLRAPGGSTITFTPTDGLYFRLAIALPGGAGVSCIVPAVALRICRAEAKS
jgi:hypothetical protein